MKQVLFLGASKQLEKRSLASQMLYSARISSVTGLLWFGPAMGTFAALQRHDPHDRLSNGFAAGFVGGGVSSLPSRSPAQFCVYAILSGLVFSVSQLLAVDQ